MLEVNWSAIPENLSGPFFDDLQSALDNTIFDASNPLPIIGDQLATSPVRQFPQTDWPTREGIGLE